MIKVKNKYVPLGKSDSMCVWPFIFYKKRLTKRIERHELIHGEQQKELLLVLFYVLYGVFWAIGWLRTFDTDLAYDLNPFEQESCENERNETYLANRRHFSWIQYL